MRWTQKAKIQKVCAALPASNLVYRTVQKRFGSLTSDPFKRLPKHAGLLSSLTMLGFDPYGTRIIEVGTGHLPVAPVAFYLAGAREVVTVDLHRRMDVAVTKQMLRQLVVMTEDVVSLYDGIVPTDILRERLAVVAAGADDPLTLFNNVGIHYVAPGDAGKMPEPDGSYDLHFSITCLEHVAPAALYEVLAEAKRLLRPGGFAAHLIDPSDHFEHGDSTINRINFLKFTNQEWETIGGNEFSYCNRLRASQFVTSFEQAGLPIVLAEPTIDQRSLSDLKAGFPLDAQFNQFALDDTCTTTLDLYAQT